MFDGLMGRMRFRTQKSQELADVGAKLQQEGKKRKLPELVEFATWVVETEAPKLQSKEQVRASLRWETRAESTLLGRHIRAMRP
jgi:hypothetical protein